MRGQDSIEEEVSRPKVEAERQSLQQRISDWLDIPMSILALIWVGLIVIELAFPLSPEATDRILKIDFAIWVIFVIDFVVEFTLSPYKRQYLRSNVLVALSLVLPFVRVVRVLRLGRVLRTVSLARITLVANRAATALGQIFSEHRIHYLLAVTAIVTLLGAAGTYYFEQGIPGTTFRTFGDALWWSATMVTTVNIGPDPVSFEGRVIALLLRAFAVAVFGYVAASFASYFVGQRISKREQDEKLEAIQDLVQEVNRLHVLIEHLRAEIEKMNRRAGGG